MTEKSQQPVFHIQRIYLKSLVLELPHAPTIFLEQQTPNIEVTIEVSGKTLANHIYECMVAVKVIAKIKERIAFIVEGTQAGVFEIVNIHDNTLSRLLGIGCPTTVYPYLRSRIAEAVLHAGFPPVHLGEIDFEQIYLRRPDEASQEQEFNEALLYAQTVVH
jgi:preprotein translocase subunit SecB